MASGSAAWRRNHGILASEHAVLLVVHATSAEQAVRNATVARDAGAGGVFLVNHGTPAAGLLAIHDAVATALPDFWIGVNCFDLPAADVFARISPRVAGVWVDDATQPEVARAGADTFVSGSGIFDTPDYAATISAMRAELACVR